MYMMMKPAEGRAWIRCWNRALFSKLLWIAFLQKHHQNYRRNTVNVIYKQGFAIRSFVCNSQVYSVGSEKDTLFERDMVSQYGCEVHTFDHTIDPEWIAPTYVNYHRVGLGGTILNLNSWILNLK